MRGIVMVGAAAATAGALALAPRARGTTWTEWFARIFRSWAGVPSGPLGYIHSHWTMPRMHGPMYAVMAEALDLRPEDELLEIACGSGVFLARHATMASYIAGLDLSDLQVDLARERLAERIAAGTAEIVKGDAADLPWQDGRFSAVTCMGSMGLFPDTPPVLAEVLRVLRPGGRAVLEMGVRLPEGAETYRRMDSFWYWNEADARRLVEEAGFVDVSVGYRDVVLNRFSTFEGMRIVRGTKAE